MTQLNHEKKLLKKIFKKYDFSKNSYFVIHIIRYNIIQTDFNKNDSGNICKVNKHHQFPLLNKPENDLPTDT